MPLAGLGHLANDLKLADLLHVTGIEISDSVWQILNLMIWGKRRSGIGIW